MQSKNGLTKFRDKRILLFGLGLHGGGLGVAKFLLKEGARLTVTDLRQRKELKPSIKELEEFKTKCGRKCGSLRYVLGKHRNSDVLSADIIVKGPGIRPDSPFIAFAEKRGIPVTSEMGIFFSLSPAKVIGVTGTRGKSTTAYLIWRFLNEKLKSGAKKKFATKGAKSQRATKVFLGGNIRKSVFEFLPRLKRNDWVVLELSSFQLDDLAKSNFQSRSPHIAVITNVLRDHLDWHGTMASYLRAKSYIFRYQKPTDYLFINAEDKLVRRLVKKAPSKVTTAILPKELDSLVDKNLGRHYRGAAALASAVARHLGVSFQLVSKVLKNFRGLEGRQERVGAINGVTFINDTTATIPEATVAALQRFYPLARKKEGKIILLAGGTDKKLNFSKMVHAIKKYAGAVVLLPGTATEKIKDQKSKTRNFPPTREVKDMKEAVKIAYHLARRGDYVILSPGAASFGLFLNEFNRGNKFVMEVRRLIQRKKREEY